MQTLFAVVVGTFVFAIPVLPQTNTAYSDLQDARRAAQVMQQNSPDGPTDDGARRRAAAAAFEAHQFEVHLADFARVWNDFVQEYADHGTYNLKKAKTLARAMKKLQAQLPQ